MSKVITYESGVHIVSKGSKYWNTAFDAVDNKWKLGLGDKASATTFYLRHISLSHDQTNVFPADHFFIMFKDSGTEYFASPYVVEKDRLEYRVQELEYKPIWFTTNTKSHLYRCRYKAWPLNKYTATEFHEVEDDPVTTADELYLIFMFDIDWQNHVMNGAEHTRVQTEATSVQIVSI